MSEFLSLLRRIGPAIVVAAVVLGPGSIVSASRVGCQYGYQLLWLVPLASLLMISLTVTSMAIGVSQRETPCGAVASAFGRPIAWLVGGAMLVAITMFQASNNNAMLMAAEGFMDPVDTQAGQPAAASALSSRLVRTAVPLVFNFAIIGLLWASRRDLYRVIEKTMAVLVAAMVVAFAINLWFASPTLNGILSGLIPSLPRGSTAEGIDTVSWMASGALVATTFSVAGAFYQSYQVREKGWNVSDFRLGVLDTFVGICSLGLITMMILITGAAALHLKVAPESLTDASAVARALDPLFGDAARYVFAAGVLAGAVSSFVVNALIGAVVFCDALGMPSKLSSIHVRLTTVGVLLLGWVVAAIGVLTEVPLADFIVVAQSLTVIAFPALAITIIWQARRIQTGLLPVWVTPLNYLGLAVTLLLSVRTIMGLIGT
ncbi:divalent metal cation transporter [Roseiconus nitratireducens]|uniref:Divalent metal cation transporter n=1 Tax=Roseiconus nitratireducens TaxID=2605748 RepID=A0A5M6D9R0_9BACT|nr:divalent metal cation transporter [Roseiconus nitratireducens]KAA5544287.1 divalent metal cation transporter [Roseiconus nitratireducens]